jgi:hypothetical protein
MNTKFIFPAANIRHAQYKHGVDKNFLKMLKETTDTKIVFFQPEEHSTYAEGDEKLCKKIEKTLKNNNCTLEIWIGNFVKNDQRMNIIDQDLIKIINWPEYLMMESYQRYKHTHKDFGYLPIDKLYTCLNRRQNYHRATIMREIFKNNLENFGYISYLTYDADPSKIFKKIFSKKIILDITGTKTWPAPGNYYHKSLINVITETTTDVLDISEKTWFSILHKRPFVILGHPGIHKKLKEMGFIMFDSIIDYNFDEINDVDLRINAIIDNLKNLKECNYQEEFNKLSPILEHNYVTFLKHVSNKNNIPDLFFEYYNDSSIMSLMTHYKRVIQECDKINV